MDPDNHTGSKHTSFNRTSLVRISLSSERGNEGEDERRLRELGCKYELFSLLKDMLICTNIIL